MPNKFLDKRGVEILWATSKNKFVSKESGKQLSTNDFTDDYKQKIDNVDPSKLTVTVPALSDSDIDEIMEV